MIRALISALLLCCDATAQDLVALTVDVGARYLDFTQPDLDGDGKDDLLFLLPGSPPTYEVWYQRKDGKGFTGKRTWPVPEGTAAVAIIDAVEPAGHDLVYLSADGARIVSGTSKDGLPRPWVDAELLFPPSYAQTLRHWAWGKDVTGDGVADLLLPGLDGALLVIGSGDGRPPKLGPVPLLHPRQRTRVDRTGGALRVRRERPRVEFAPMLPGSPCPTWLERDGLYLLERRGHAFAEAPTKFFPLPSAAPRGLGLLRRIDVDLEDLNGDGLAELILTRTEATGGGIPERRTTLLLFKNRGKPGGKPSQAILLPGVLSSGPDFRDIDGDGNVDLFLSVFAGDMKSEMQRRMFGRVTLDYYLYLGSGGNPPFPRSPNLSVRDKLDSKTFETWGLRHRRQLSRDWNGDGKVDLVEVSSKRGATRVAIRYATGVGATLSFSDSGPEFTWRGDVVDYTTTALEAGGRPAVRLKTPTGVTFITRP